MLKRRTAPLSACLLALMAPRPSAAAAVEQGCLGPTIEADGAFRERFPELVEQIRAQLPARADVDACAIAELRLRASLIVVAVALPDGRATAREVSRREDVLPTLQALLLVPEPAPASPTTAAATAPVVEAIQPKARAQVPERRPARSTSPLGARDRDAPHLPPVPQRSFGFELSLISGVRAGDGQFGYGGGLLSFVELSRWLVGFQGRADGYRSILGGDPETALTLGLLFGRRFDLSDTAVDVIVGPAVAMRGASFSQTAPAPSARPEVPKMPPNEPDVGPVPRLLFGARLGFTPHSVFRTFVGVDGELGPRRERDVPPSDDTSGRMPAFTLGVALGATVGTR